MSSGQVRDLSGNPSNSFFSSFTTAAVADVTPPSVTMVTPSDGASNVGLNAKVVLTFSKSMMASTINYQNFGLLVNGSWLGLGVSSSPDNRVVTLSPSALPPSSTVTVMASSGVTDLSGNHLPDFQSQFTTASAFAIAHPAVVAQHPGNGAQGVPANASVVVYLSEPMISASVQGAFYVAVNGALASGTTQVTNNGQVVQFTPSTAWPPNTLVQVFLDSSAQDVDGNSASSYQGSFTTAVDANTVTPSVTSTNPASSATGVHINVVIDFAYNQPLDPTSVNTGAVQCRQNNTWFQTDFVSVSGCSSFPTARFWESFARNRLTSNTESLLRS